MFKASFDVKMVSISAILKPENFTEQNKKMDFFVRYSLFLSQSLPSMTLRVLYLQYFN